MSRTGRMMVLRSDRGGAAYDGGYGENRRRRDSDGRFLPSRRNDGRQIGFESDRGSRMWTGYDSRGSERREDRGSRRGRGESMEFDRIDRQTADRWVRDMQAESGMEMWPREMTRQIAEKNGMEDLDENEFFAVFNAMFSDYYKVAQRWGVDKVDFYADLTKAFLEDRDAVEDKAAVYYACIVRKE